MLRTKKLTPVAPYIIEQGYTSTCSPRLQTNACCRVVQLHELRSCYDKISLESSLLCRGKANLHTMGLIARSSTRLHPALPP